MICISTEHSSIIQISQAKVLQNICQNLGWLLLLFINNSGLNGFLPTRHYKSMKLQCHTKCWKFLCVCNRFYLMNKLMRWSESQNIPAFLSCHLLYIYIICKSTLFAIALPYTSGCAVPTTVSATATFTQKSTDVYLSEMIYKVYGDFLRDMNSIENEMCKIYTVLFISILLIVIGKKD